MEKIKDKKFCCNGFELIWTQIDNKIPSFIRVFKDNNYIGNFTQTYDENRFVFQSSSQIYNRVENLWQSDFYGDFQTEEQMKTEVIKFLQFYSSRGEWLVNYIVSLYHKFYYEFENFQFDLTCEFAPQQYEVYRDYKYIGYIRIRHGCATFTNAPLGTVCYLNEMHDYNETFDERKNFLEYCVNAYKKTIR